MSLDTVKLGNLSVSRMILGGNPFAGFSHQNPQRDEEMRRDLDRFEREREEKVKKIRGT